MRKSFSIVILASLLLSLLTLAFDVQHVKASGTIYIRADGSIDPSTAPISTNDNITYMLTADVFDTIVVERDNTVVDGNGWTVQGSETSDGFYLSGIYNVIVRNVTIQGFYRGVYAISSSLITISHSNITNNTDGVCLGSSSNVTVSGNIIDNNDYGVYLYSSANNTVSGNTVANNGYGVDLWSSSNNNTVSGNVFIDDGLFVYDSYDNVVLNNSVNDKPLVYLEDVSDMVVEDAGQVILVNCNHIRVENLNLSRTTVGVELWGTNSTVLSCNTISNNIWDGIYLLYSSSNVVLGNSITGNGVNLHYSSNNNTVSGNNITASNDDGVYLYSSSGNTVSGNTIANNGDGVYLSYSSGNTVSGNTIANNGDGVYLSYSSGNTVSGNTIANNGYGVDLRSSSNNNTVSGNNITSNYYGVDLSFSSNNNTVSGNNIANNEDGVDLRYSSSNDITGNSMTNNSYGLYLTGSNSCLISGNTITLNDIGVVLSASVDCIVSCNNIANQEGIVLHESHSNTVYHNNFLDNHMYASMYSIETNAWDNGCEGNYWNDYNGTDINGDGIGDTPYTIDVGNKDNYPLMDPYWNIADINHDLIVDIYDVVTMCTAYVSTPLDSNWNCHCDITEPYGLIDIYDVVLMCNNYGETYEL